MKLLTNFKVAALESSKNSFLFLFTACFSLTLFAREPQVTAIEIRGNRKIENAAVLQKVKTRAGTLFSKDLVREDIRSIYSLGYFDNIEVLQEDAAGGIKVIYVVKEKAIVSKIEFEGLENIDKDDTKDLVLVKEYEVLDLAKVNTSVEKLVQKYEEKGYYLADVRYEIIPDEKRNEAVLKFHIEENDKIQVKKINIIGNKVMSGEDLRAVMQTKEGGPFSWLSGSGSYREAVFERDIAAMGFYYGTKGYVRARFGKPEVAVSPDKKWIYITFNVEEGDQYSVGDVDFKGEFLYSREELKEDLKLIKAETFNTEILRQETLKFTEKYSDLGYAFANVVPQPNIHDDTKTVDVNFEVDRGEKVYIGKIVVTSNTRTKDKVVRRELSFHEGELFNGTKKRESRDNVVRLGFFDSVEFHQSTSKSAPNVVDIEVKVKERSTGQLVIGAGYATGNIGFTAQAQLSQNNFLGNGQVASLSAMLQTGDGGKYEYNLSFQEPYVGSSLWSLGGDLYQTRRQVLYLTEVPSYYEIKTGADIKLGHPVFEFTNLFLTYKFEHAYVSHGTIIDKKIFPVELMNGFTSSLTGSVVFDKRDDRYDPRQGYYWSAGTELAGLGGDRKYLRTSLNAKFFHPIFWDFIFRLNLTGGNISSTTSEPVPPNELYVMGGLFSLRGFDFLTIGPSQGISGDPLDLSEKARTKLPGLAGQQITVGGHNQVLANAEIEFPILKEARLRGVLFFDAGNAFDDWNRVPDPKILLDIGWGFRWFTPIGPLRFEFGYPINKGGETKFFFTIGPAF